MGMKRRQFLTQAAAGASTLFLGTGIALAEAPARVKHDPFEQVALGKTGIKLSRVGIGTGMRGGMRESNQTRLGEAGLHQLLRNSFDRGVNFIDSADLYGSHPYILPALEGIPREDYVVCSKIWFRDGGIPETERPPADVVVERFLKEMKTSYIDLLLMHCVRSPGWRTELSDDMERLAKLKKRGLIRAHGCSFHTLESLAESVNEPWCESVHARINPYAASMDVKTEEEVPKVANILRQLRAQGQGVVGMKIIGEGRFRNSDERRNTSIAYAFNSGCTDCVIVGFERETEIDDFAERTRKAPVEQAA